MVTQKKTAVTISTGDLVTVAEAAKILGKHIVTIYRWHEAGQVMAVKLGGILFIPVSELERLKNANKSP